MTGAIAGTALLDFKHDTIPGITTPIYKEAIFMAGAIAGTALLDLKPEKNKGKSRGSISHGSIDVVTMTVNNSCNSSGCPHCYLQYNGSDSFAADEVLNAVIAAQFRHLAIVGKEPLFNAVHAQRTAELVKKARDSGKTVSMITNGLNLEYLSNPSDLKFVDISFDGGPKTYSRSDYASLIRKINACAAPEINALHTVYKENIGNIADMVRIADDASFKTILFSPYILTQNQGSNAASIIPISFLLEKFAGSKEFMNAANALLNIDLFHAKQDGISMREIKERVSQLGLQHKVKLFEKDLLEGGVVRVTYDGFVLSPEDSLHTASYAKESIRLNGNLSRAYEQLLEMIK